MMENIMARREKSDGRVVVQGRVMATETAATRGAKATTASEVAVPQNLFAANNGAAVEAKPASTEVTQLPAMTMEEVASASNLMSAFNKVASNKGAPGPDGMTIAEVRKHIGVILPGLRRDLLQGRFQLGKIRRVWIPKPGGGERGLGIPDVVDRVVQQAVLQVLSPHYEPTFHPSSHGFRPGRSCHTAIAEAKEHMAQGYGWVVDLDLAKFFDTVHHDRLMARLATRIGDKPLLKLLRKMLQAKVVMPGGLTVATTVGTPQGGPLSPLLSNIVLDELDWELEARGHKFVRYADDCNVYVRSEAAGKRVMAATARFIEGRLRLKVNEPKSAVAQPETRHFLGFTLRRRSQGPVEVLLSARSKDRMRVKIRELTPRNWGHSFADCIQRTNVYLRGWYGYFGICSRTTENNRTMQFWDAHIRRRLRAIRLKQWKSKSTIVAGLTRLGAEPERARAAVYGGSRSIWSLSHTYAVEQATMSPKWFSEQGLVSLEKCYKTAAKSRKPVTVLAPKPKALRAQATAKQGNLFPPPGFPKSRM